MNEASKDFVVQAEIILGFAVEATNPFEWTIRREAKTFFQTKYE